MHESPQSAQPDISKTRRLLGRAPRTRSVIAATGLLVICAAPFASARTGAPCARACATARRRARRRSSPTSRRPRRRPAATRPGSPTSRPPAAARSTAAARRPAARRRFRAPQNPCIRANNLSTGFAFEFNASDGAVAGLITVGAGGDATKPFITNATGVATGLNADRVDKRTPQEIVAAARVKTGLDADTLDGKDSTDVQARFAPGHGQRRPIETRGLIANNPTPTAGRRVHPREVHGRPCACALSATIIGTTPVRSPSRRASPTTSRRSRCAR